MSSGPPPQSTAVGDIVGRFTAGWEWFGPAPDLTDYLPADPALRRVSLIELIKVDLEKRWLRGDHPKRLAEYRDLRRATQSQYWMLALMVSFTVLGLMLLSSANS